MSLSRVLRSQDENFLSLKSQTANSSQSFHCRFAWLTSVQTSRLTPQSLLADSRNALSCLLCGHQVGLGPWGTEGRAGARPGPGVVSVVECSSASPPPQSPSLLGRLTLLICPTELARCLAVYSYYRL